MTRLLRHLPLFRCVVCGTVGLLNLLHPVLHSVDGGVIDGVLVHLDMLAASLLTIDPKGTA